MGPKNKQNGFIFYANRIRNELLKEGHVIRNTNDLIAAASPKWRDLSAEDKEMYKTLAKEDWENKNKNPSQNQIKHNSVVSMANDNTDKFKVIEFKRKREHDEVSSEWLPGRQVLDEKFYFPSFVCLLEEPEYQPLEIAVVEYSLRNGIERTFHKHINPGPIPQGYRFIAQQKSNLTHEIPVEGIALPEDTYPRIYDELINFLSGNSGKIPPLFVRISECDKTDMCLKWLAKKAGRTYQLKRVYELESLILDLDAHLSDRPKSINSCKQNATDLISSTIFDWDAGTRCQWHEEKGSKTCALGFVNRYCYCLSDYFCENFDIPVTDQHLPLKKEVCYTLIPSISSQKSKNNAQSVRNGCIENLADEVASRMRVLSEDQEERLIQEKHTSQLKSFEQQKRWAVSRGGKDHETDLTTNEINKIAREQCQNNNNTNVIENKNGIATSDSNKRGCGRGLLGRGRGALGKTTELRKPGEVPRQPITIQSTSHNIQKQINDTENLYAGPIAAPHPSTAPLPPASWVT